MPKKRLGSDPARAIIKKATTNSRQPKNFAIFIKLLISLELDQYKIKQETAKIKI